MGAFQSCPGQIAYSTAKSALLAMTRSIAIDHGRENIRCNAICPGLIKTAMTDESFAMLGGLVGKSLEQTREDMTRLVPLKRWAEPEEIAAAIAFLASDDASYMTGSSMVVDAGASIVEPGVTSLIEPLLEGKENA
jgi:NAD(P)-dependent dehydrogenase (short-subunit alcohol dehydrogenase family)